MAYTGGQVTGNKLSPKRVLELEKVHAAIELRKRGKSFQEIAEICGWANRNGPYLAIQRHLTRNIREASTELIELEVLRLDALLDAQWPLAMGGDDKAATIILKIMERRAKLLGLDKPVEQKISVSKTEEPTPPADLTKFQVDLVRALSLAGALDLPLPDEAKYLNGGGLLLEGGYEQVPAKD